MKALTWHGKRDVRVENVPDPTIAGADRRDHPRHVDRDLRLRPAPLRGARPVHGRRATSSATSRWASSRRSAPTSTELAVGRPRRRPVQHLVRHCCMCDAGPAVAVRDDPGARARHGRRAVRLHEALRPGARRPGRVPARAVRRTTARSRCRTARRTTASSSSPTCCRRRGRPSSTPTCPTAARRRARARADRRHGARVAQHRGAGRVIGVDLVPERLERARAHGVEALDLHEHERRPRAT